MKKRVKKAVRFQEKEDAKGGAIQKLAPAELKPITWNTGVKIEPVVDTPLKRAHREFTEHWAPMHKYADAPDFALLRSAVQHDTTDFNTREREYLMPVQPPTGGGFGADDRETSHFVHETLRRINPVLSQAYLHAPVDDLHDKMVSNSDITYGDSEHLGRGGPRPNLVFH